MTTFQGAQPRVRLPSPAPARRAPAIPPGDEGAPGRDGIGRWHPGNRLSLLINGEQFYPRVNAAINAAQREILMETFILFDDAVGRDLRRNLIRATHRGVHVELTIDGYGSYPLTAEFLSPMVDAGVRVHVFDPHPTVFGMRTNLFRRMHRKLIVVDGATAFVGGINHSEDHLLSHGPEAKQDYAVEVTGPVVADIRRLCAAPLSSFSGRRWRRPRHDEPGPGSRAGAMACLVSRDNHHHRDDIERQYLAAINGARRSVYIANAYFFPGFRFLRALRRAAARGAVVRLILQGKPDKPVAKKIASTLYRYLMRGGVRIYEYCQRPLHGKVAVVDSEWATVGSSNLDPLSLALNLEANLVVRDPGFARALHDHLDNLIREDCREAREEELAPATPWENAVNFVTFHLLRRFPAWLGWLPAHVPRLVPCDRQGRVLRDGVCVNAP